ncbi:carbonate dehydratase [Pseudomonas fluvialis]|uniref:Cation-transporting P-type ATPase n=1 Tax=Pseudomonas fluvialis TaxID=1793966 RepID=A0ABQ2AMP3_9PSED|nr:HAD-IC family P-type ATPase [Pseudomonas fluvialis]OXM39573.1 carbonate dehydratase [Pseudomonas fluvialis]GGH92078.1 cation-transporting P-type ATPase [Pseudomonas fluvialis]
MQTHHDTPAWHALDGASCLQQLDSQSNGLTAEQVRQRVQQYGPNSLPSAPPPPAWRRFLRQMQNTLIYVLLGCAGLTLLLGHWLDSLVILGVVLINALVGFIQEGRAEQAMRAIAGLLSLHCRVRREHGLQELPAEQLVPGDIVLLEEGDRVPADLRLLNCRDLRIEEAALTGESLPADKQSEPVSSSAVLADRQSMAYSGCLVSAGSGYGVVVATGQATELGRISHLLQQVEVLQTPLLRDMARFARQLSLVILVLAAATLAFGFLLRDYSSAELLMASVSLAVAAIPEGLPAVLTIILALGVQRMARERAIICRLPAVESLGAVTVICSDKTGTLTRNEMTVQHLFCATAHYQVEGIGYAPYGALCNACGETLAQIPAEVLQLARAGLLANHGTLYRDQDTWQISGDPTEAALLTLAGKLGLDSSAEHAEQPRVDSLPFSSERRCTASLHHDHHGNGYLYWIGAPERLLEVADQQWQDAQARPIDHNYWQDCLHQGASMGLRMLGIGMRRMPADKQQLDYADIEAQFILLGLVGLQDPPREEAIRAIAACHSAGIAVKMITGDHVATATAIAARLGLVGTRALTGAQLDELDDPALDACLDETAVFARTTPEHKLRLVQRLQACGARVAMTGDGVNDAPALKRADIGIAMGIKGTEAAKSAAQMVLADDNFATLERAVAQGRAVYDNLKKSILFILPTNGGQAMVMLSAILLGLQLPITPLQILWVNMVTAVTLALALAFEPAEAGLMQRPPRDPRQPLLSGLLLWRIVFVSLLLTGACLGLFLYSQQLGWSLEASRSLAVNALVLGEMGYLFSTRRLHGVANFAWRDNPMAWTMVGILLVLQLAFIELAWLQQLFATQSIGWQGWLYCLPVAVLICLLSELEKYLLRRWQLSSIHKETP